ncbi:unnamed protein product [Paramecium pentaurelia]|uniref:Ankyrin repeat protein n=1 Tax=Paramecium pentaurelia TaxID=43138 RepID=A0A8S1UC71_9CILI|nr:unnamed protein product [Paramecium pentaurelia]
MINIKQIIQAIKGQNIQDLKKFNPSPEQECGNQKMKLIHLAASNPSIEILEYFVEKSQNLEITDSIGRTPLHYAVNYGLLKNVQLLIKKGAKIEAQTLGGDTPLIKSALLKNNECYHYLISEGANKLHQNCIGQSAEQIYQQN